MSDGPDPGHGDGAGDVLTRQLGAIGELADWARRAGVPLWLRGGWAVDFAVGEITRSHADIDWFVEAGDAHCVREHLVDEGWAVTREQSNAVDLAREGKGLDHGIAFFGRRGTELVVPFGPFAGEPWPTGMLDGPSRTLRGVTCRIVSVAAQIEIKRMMPTWVPGLPRRAQDASDIERLTRLLATMRG